MFACRRAQTRPNCVLRERNNSRTSIIYNHSSAKPFSSSIHPIPAVKPAPREGKRRWLREKLKFGNLQQFLSYLDTLENTKSAKTDDQLTATYRGTKFEFMALEAFQGLGFDFKHVGMRGDGGVDLRGTWSLPDQTISVVCQCKREKRKLGARVLRELEGSMLHADAKVGVMISHTSYSKPALAHAQTSPIPLILSVMDEEGISFFQPNATLALLLPKLVVGSRFLPPSHSMEGPKRMPVLMYDGNSITKPR